MSESWLASRWRPIMAIVYAAVVVFDFIVAPIMWGLLIYFLDGDAVQWKPLTLTDGGLFHVAMGAILGITAWTRGQEKVTAIEAFASAPDNKDIKEQKL